MVKPDPLAGGLKMPGTVARLHEKEDPLTLLVMVYENGELLQTFSDSELDIAGFGCT